MNEWLDVGGLNQGAVVDLFERYRRDPSAVDPETRRAFDSWAPPGLDVRELPGATVVAVVTLAESVRRYGHLAANIDPFGGVRSDPVLELETYRLTPGDLARLPAHLVEGPAARHAANALEALEWLRGIYCGSTGHDYAHVFAADERRWLHEAAEHGWFRPPAEPIDGAALLERLSEVDVFEQFLHRTFPGRTRFSIEGLDMLVPVLDEIISDASDDDTRLVFLGMAHRGRLNVMAHVLGRSYEQILAEFKDPVGSSGREGTAWTGDVKYHKGARRKVRRSPDATVTIVLPPNPSHLEAIDPVVLGLARAAATDVSQPGAGRFDPRLTLPILIHGDAAFAGQGVVAETLNLNGLRGYSVGGTVHIITNNQLGFTATVSETRSTLYASGIARSFKIPIVHVNADDPAACTEAARLAVAYRRRFGKDFVIDLVGYRRYGHNEGDEPSFTQPRLYDAIREHPRVREIWARRLVDAGEIDEAQAAALERHQMTVLQTIWTGLKEAEAVEEPSPSPPAGEPLVATGVPLARLRELNRSLLELPEGFACHPKLQKARERRRSALDDPDARHVDWATAEALALAGALGDGVAVRLTGQDVERGTFGHRHAVFHDIRTAERFVPLQALSDASASFEIHNSPLTEYATLAFEYGYNVQAPDRLVIWEAQYGDFVNGAQIVVDEFLASARQKWGQTPSLVLLLPHGDEGQGPDHASARPERFLQLAAHHNLSIACCTTAAQYFHVLRRQAGLIRCSPTPLVLLTPKSLLRDPRSFATPAELTDGAWRAILDDSEIADRRDAVTRLLLCSGKVFYDLVAARDREHAGAAVCRVEQLYPVPARDLRDVATRYPNLDELVWVQEEMENMGAWSFMRPHLEELAAAIGRETIVRYVGRPASGSPAEGSAARYRATQKRLVERAFREGGVARTVVPSG